MICADVIAGIGTLPKTRIALCFTKLKEYIISIFSLRRKEGLESKYTHVALIISTKSIKTNLGYYDNLVNASLSRDGCHPNIEC